MNKEQNVGTEADSDMQPIVLPFASLAQNPLLGVVVSELKDRVSAKNSKTINCKV